MAEDTRRRERTTRQGASSSRPSASGRQSRASRPSASGRRRARPDAQGTAGERTNARATAGAAAGERPVAGTSDRDTMRARGRQLAQMRSKSIAASAVILCLGALIGMLFFLRPTTSAVEKRELTAFPEVTFGRVTDGSFFSDFAVWYSDTYPIREPLVGMSLAMQGLYGIQPKTQMVGGNVVADELPPAGTTTGGSSADATSAATAQTTSTTQTTATPTNVVERVVTEIGYRTQSTNVEVPEARVMAEAIQDKIMAGLYVDGDAAYNVYYFDQESVEQYAKAINTCQANLRGKAQVYSILAPTSAAILLDDSVYQSLGGTDQGEAIKYFISLYDRDVRGVNVFDALRAHRDEYVYFRTDHHWTELGAYYAYLEFCKMKGVEPSNILARKKMTFKPFLGTFYAEVGNAAMEANPDYVDAYVPNSTNDMIVWDEYDDPIETNVITDVSDWNVYSAYNCFISGDRPLERIDNPLKNDGSSCLVIKDSIGCAFVPLLVDDYQTVWIIDFRYSDRSIPDFVIENGIDDVIFINTMVLAGTDPVSAALLSQSQSKGGASQTPPMPASSEEGATGTTGATDTTGSTDATGATGATGTTTSDQTTGQTLQYTQEKSDGVATVSDAAATGA